VVGHRVQAFCLTGGNLRAAAMAEHYLAVIDEVAGPAPDLDRSCTRCPPAGFAAWTCERAGLGAEGTFLRAQRQPGLT